MNWIEKILSLIFPSKKDYFNLQMIPRSPRENGKENVFSFFDYQSSKGRELIYYIKKHRDPLLIEKIAAYIYDELLEELSQKNEFAYFLEPLVIPIPITQKRYQERGFNQTHDIAKYLSQYVQGQYKNNILYKIRETKKQALISQRHKRKKNVLHSFAIKDKYKKDIQDKDIILVDDLYTTGATVNEARRILLKNKVRNIIIITIAH
jgi:ComF family protein